MHAREYFAIITLQGWNDKQEGGEVTLNLVGQCSQLGTKHCRAAAVRIDYQVLCIADSSVLAFAVLHIQEFTDDSCATVGAAAGFRPLHVLVNR